MITDCEVAKHNKHVLNGAVTVPLVMTTFGKLGPSAQGFLQILTDGTSSTGVVDRGLWLRIAMQYLSCTLVRGRGIVFRRYYQGIAKSDGKDFRDREKVTSTRARKQALVA